MAGQQHIGVGKITGVFGVKGWIKVFSDTTPKENILTYSPWRLEKGNEQKQLKVVDGRLQGKAVVAQLEGVDDRDQAALLSGCDITIERNQLSETAADEYYWSDLVGLQVRTTEDVDLGVVDYLIETGANDVLVVKGERERLIPFLQGRTVLEIDLESRAIRVDWDPEF